jgi:hypothetical protein
MVFGKNSQCYPAGIFFSQGEKSGNQLFPDNSRDRWSEGQTCTWKKGVSLLRRVLNRQFLPEMGVVARETSISGTGFPELPAAFLD